VKWNCCQMTRPQVAFGAREAVEKKIDSDSQLESNLIDSLKLQTAGDPDDPDTAFTSQTPSQTADQVTQQGTPVHRNTVKAWYRESGLGLRQMSKDIAGGCSPDRQEQFKRIGDLTDLYERDGNPVFSIDTKAKEFIGRLYRKGRLYGTNALQAFDHDFPSWADGKVIPHGIYDIRRNVGHINIGLSHDTSEFAADSLRWYWNRIGKQCYGGASSILLLCDCGGSNAANRYLFKYYLQELSDTIGVPIRVAHLPS
jgi:Rhodopirellula transposase.